MDRVSVSVLLHAPVRRPGGMDRAAVIQCPDVNVHCRRCRLVPDHGAAESSVQRHALVGDSNQLGRGPISLLSLGNAFLPKSDLGAGNKEQVVDSAKLHCLHHGVGPVIAGILAPPSIVRDCFSHQRISFKIILFSKARPDYPP
jgi:hypothetical protein